MSNQPPTPAKQTDPDPNLDQPLDLHSIERIYTYSSEAQDRATRWERLGISAVEVTPYTAPDGWRGYRLIGMATDAQVAEL